MGLAQIRLLPGLAGKQQYLPVLGNLQQHLQGGGHPLVVKGDQRIVQNQRRRLLLGEQHVTDRQAYRQIELVCRPLAQLPEGAGKGVPRLRGGLQLPVEQYSIILPSGEFCKVFRRFFSKLRGEAVLQGCIGGGQGLEGQGDGVVFPLELPVGGLLFRQLLPQFGGAAGELELPLGMGQALPGLPEGQLDLRELLAQQLGRDLGGCLRRSVLQGVC